jgi:hypothetical protein
MTMKRTKMVWAFVIAAGVSSLIGGVAHAQDLESPAHRQGYYVAMGLEGAGQELWDKGSARGPWGGSGISLRLGELLTPRFGLGLVIGQAMGKKDGQTLAGGGLGVEAHLAVWRTLGVHVGSGLGFVSLDNPKDLDEKTRGLLRSALHL